MSPRYILIVAFAAASMFTGFSANAADLAELEPSPVVSVPSFSWSGAYIGVQAGYGRDRASQSPILVSLKGALIGPYAGYSYQFDGSPVVIGAETDFNWSTQDTRFRFLGFGFKTRIEWAGASRIRIGFAFDRILIYSAAGVAYTRFKTTVSGPAGSSGTQHQIGWTAGGGAEYAITDHFLGRVEYRYSDYGRKLGVKLTENRVMGGIGYKF